MDVTDQWIKGEILEEFVRLNLSGFEEIDISVCGGFVKLEGWVQSHDIRNQYADTVLKTDGVVSLLNKIRVYNPMKHKVRPVRRKVKRL